MPIVTGQDRTNRSRRARAFWLLLLVPPLLALALFTSSTFRPVRLGPFVLSSGWGIPSKRASPLVVSARLPQKTPIMLHNNEVWTVDGGGSMVVINLGNRYFTISWFRGYPFRLPAPKS